MYKNIMLPWCICTDSVCLSTVAKDGLALIVYGHEKTCLFFGNCMPRFLLLIIHTEHQFIMHVVESVVADKCYMHAYVYCDNHIGFS